MTPILPTVCLQKDALIGALYKTLRHRTCTLPMAWSSATYNLCSTEPGSYLSIRACRITDGINLASKRGHACKSSIIGDRSELLQDVLHVSDLRHDLVSVGKLDRRGNWVVFGGGRCVVTSQEPDVHGRTLLEAELHQDGLYHTLIDEKCHDAGVAQIPDQVRDLRLPVRPTQRKYPTQILPEIRRTH